LKATFGPSVSTVLAVAGASRLHRRGCAPLNGYSIDLSIRLL
jgi:hypothetical protein